jgi:hypothetical protein
MRKVFGWFLLVVGVVAVWEAMYGETRTTNYTVIGLLFLVTIVPGVVLIRKRPPK